MINIFIALFMAILICNTSYSAKAKVLIDFSKYEENNKSNKYLYTKENDNIRQDIYNNPNYLNQTNEIQVRNRFIPRLEITPDDISLNKWIVKLVYPKDLYTPTPTLSKRKQSPYSKYKNMNEALLGVAIDFSNIYDSSYAVIHPGFKLYESDKRGKLANIGNGILNNVGEIEKIYITVGFIGKPKNNLLYLNLRDHKERLTKHPVGFIYKEQNRNYKYFRDYDGKSFSSEVAAKDIERFISKNSQKQDIYFYKVYYKNGAVVLWTMYKNSSPIYNETILEWNNSKYLPITRRTLKRQQLYPREIPYIKFDSFVLEKKDGTIGNKFYLFIKDIKVKYDLAVPSYYLDIDDEEVWSNSSIGIVRKQRVIRRKKLEIANALKIYNMIRLSWKKGFIKTNDGYSSFKKHYDYFLCYYNR